MRKVIERSFNRMKHWRGLASHYDAYAVVHRGAVLLAAIVDRLEDERSPVRVIPRFPVARARHHPERARGPARAL